MKCNKALVEFSDKTHLFVILCSENVKVYVQDVRKTAEYDADYLYTSADYKHNCFLRELS